MGIKVMRMDIRRRHGGHLHVYELKYHFIFVACMIMLLIMRGQEYGFAEEYSGTDGPARIFLNEKSVECRRDGTVVETVRKLTTPENRKIEMKWLQGFETVSIEKVALLKGRQNQWDVVQDLSKNYSRMTKDFGEKNTEPHDSIEKTFIIPAGTDADAFETVIKRERDFSDFNGSIWVSHVFSADVPVEKAALTVSIPENIPLYIEKYGVGEPDKVVKDGIAIYSFKAMNLAPGGGALGKPAYVMCSTVRTWDDLAEWFRNIYDVKTKPDPDIREVAYKYYDEVEDTSYRARLISGYVYNEVVNESFPGGASPFYPREARKVFHSRKGDCKDKVVLLMSMLNLNRIEAFPAFVSLKETGSFENRLPNIFYFDHVLVYVPVQDGIDKEMWLDPTLEKGIASGEQEIYKERYAFVVEDGGESFREIASN